MSHAIGITIKKYFSGTSINGDGGEFSTGFSLGREGQRQAEREGQDQSREPVGERQTQISTC